MNSVFASGIVVSVRSSSVRSVSLWFYSHKPPGLIFQPRLLTTEAQSSQRRSAFLSIQPKKSHPIASGIVVSVRSSSVRSATLWFYSRKPPGLISQLRLLTTEAQSSQRRSAFLSIQPKKSHPIASGDSRLRSFVLCALCDSVVFIP